MVPLGPVLMESAWLEPPSARFAVKFADVPAGVGALAFATTDKEVSTLAHRPGGSRPSRPALVTAASVWAAKQ